MGEDYCSPFQKTWTTGTKVLAFEKSGLKTFRPERKSFCTYVMKRNTYINKKNLSEQWWIVYHLPIEQWECYPRGIICIVHSTYNIIQTCERKKKIKSSCNNYCKWLNTKKWVRWEWKLPTRTHTVFMSSSKNGCFWPHGPGRPLRRSLHIKSFLTLQEREHVQIIGF